MTTQADGRSRSGSLAPLPEAQIRTILSVQNRLDEAEAELAAVVTMAQRRGIKYLHEMGEPLLDELDDLVTRLRRLILETGPAASCRPEARGVAPGGHLMSMTEPAAHRRLPRA